MLVMWQVEFTSAEFLPVLPEECQVNPGCYGFELAWWLAKQLASRGLLSSYPHGDDHCWYLDYADAQGVEFSIGCFSVAEEDDGYRGGPIRWGISVRPHVSIKERLGRVSRSNESEQLGGHLLEILRDGGIVAEVIQR